MNPPVKNILVLCHGNVNRSALAGAVLNHRIVVEQVPFVRVVSAGFIKGGRRAPPKTRNFVQDKGLCLDQHRSAQVTPSDLVQADVIIYMDDGNFRRLHELSMNNHPTLWERTKSIAVNLGWFLPTPARRIADPGFMKGDSKEYRDVMESIYLAASRFPLRPLPSADYGTKLTFER